MLHILRIDVDAHQVVLIVQGYIMAKWADMLERECLELSRSGLHIVLDLSGVFFIGRTGLEALARLSRSGLEIAGCSKLIAEVLEQEGIDVGRDP